MDYSRCRNRCRLICIILRIIVFVVAVYLSYFFVMHYHHDRVGLVVIDRVGLVVIVWLAVVLLYYYISLGAFRYQLELSEKKTEQELAERLARQNQLATERRQQQQLETERRQQQPPCPDLYFPHERYFSNYPSPSPPLESSTSTLPSPPPSPPRPTPPPSPPRPTATATLLTKEEQAVVQVAADNGLPPLKTFTPDKCVICMQEFMDGDVIQPFGICLHEFHSSCLQSWLNLPKTTCPSCRQHLLLSKGT